MGKPGQAPRPSLSAAGMTSTCPTRGWALIDFSAAGVFAFFFCAAACAVLASTFSMFRAHAFTLFGAIFVHTALQWPTQALDKWLGRRNHPCCGARSKWRSPGVRESDTPDIARTHSAIRREHAAQQVNISLVPSGPFALCLFMPFAAALYRYEPDQLLADGLTLLFVLLVFGVLLIVLLLFSWFEEWWCGNRDGLRVAKCAVVLLTLLGAVVLACTLGAAVVQELVKAQGDVRSWVAESVNNNNDTLTLTLGQAEGAARGYVADRVAKLQVWAAPHEALQPFSVELGCMHAALSAKPTTANATNTTWPEEDGKWGGGEEDEEPTPVASSSPGQTCRVFRPDGSDPMSNLFALSGGNTSWSEMASQGGELINWAKVSAAGQDIARWVREIFSYVLGLLASGGGVLMELVIFASFLSALPPYSKGSLVEIVTNALLPASEQTRERVADRLQGIVTNIFLLPLRRAAHRLPLAWAMFTACEEGGFPLRHCCALLCVLVGSMQVVDDSVVLIALILPWWWFGGGEWERLVRLVVFGGLYLKFVYDLDAMLLKELANVEKEKKTRGLDLEKVKKEEKKSAAYIQSLAVVLGISQFGFRGMFIGPMLCSCVQLLYAETGEYFKNNKPAPLCGVSLRERQPPSHQTGGGGGGDGGGGAQEFAEDEDERKESGAGQPHHRNTRQEKKNQKKKKKGR